MEIRKMNYYYKYASSYPLPEYHEIGYNDPSIFLHVNSAGIYTGKVPHIIHRTNGRKDYYLSYNLSGKTYIYFDNEKYIVKGGDLFIFCPQQPQVYRYEIESNFANYWVHFTGHTAEELLRSSGLLDSIVITLGYSPEICDYVDRIINELNNLRAHYDLTAASEFISMCAFIARRLKENYSVGQIEQNKRIINSIDYIRRNYKNHLDIRKLANEALMSPTYYSAIFKQITGKSPQQYITNFRLQQAIKLMYYKNIRIGEIALEVGFDDSLYFSRIFHKHMHMSPSSFRESIKQCD